MCRGFLLPASHVIHTVGPIYDVDSNPAASLASAYRLLFQLVLDKLLFVIFEFAKVYSIVFWFAVIITHD